MTQRKKYLTILFICLLSMLFSACGLKQKIILPSVETAVHETVSAIQKETQNVSVTPLPSQTAYPTFTVYPTYTKQATSTVYPTQTPRPTQTKLPTYTPFPTLAKLPTYTPFPTHTKYPTNTPYPTNTSAVIRILVTATADNNITKAPRSDGFYLVGTEIASGVWRSEADTSERAKCYWKISDIKGNIITNFLGASGGTIPIPSEAYQVEIRSCGEISYVEDFH